MAIIIPETQKPHFVLFPFMAQGHMIPMVDIARLLAKRGVSVTILITPLNENRFKTVLTRAIASGLSIHIRHLSLPCSEAGLPEGCENFDMLPSIADAFKFFTAIAMMENQVQQLLQHLKPEPSCLISDMCYPWTSDVALRLSIPRIVFHGTSCFAQIFMHMAATDDLDSIASSDTEYFVMPDLPDKIEITKAQIRGTANEIPPEWAKVRRQMAESDTKAFGTVANTFQELETEYINKYIKVKSSKNVWCIGPVSLSNEADQDKAERGNKASIDEDQCVKWLDSQEQSSVIYVCLGSLSKLSNSQLKELGLGLEASNKPFVWVIRNASDEFKAWLSEEKFEERVKGRGLLIQGWAPQVVILSHPSVGGFLTHCGWNSTLEGITAGLPMMTWPVFAEQFINEKFIVNVIRTGVRMGVEVPVVIGEEENVGVQVTSDDVKRVVERFMDGGEEDRERRERARKLGEMAKGAVEEGGSSYLNLGKLIQDVVVQQTSNRKVSDSDAEKKLDYENNSGVVVQ